MIIANNTKLMSSGVSRILVERTRPWMDTLFYVLHYF